MSEAATLAVIALDAPASAPLSRSSSWLKDARRARALSWISLLWITAEGVIGVGTGIASNSIALLGFGVSSVVEGLASVIVIWRFTGTRTESAVSEPKALRAVAIGFFIFGPYVGVASLMRLTNGEHAQGSAVGIGLALTSMILMPVLGTAKRRLGARLGSGATAGEGTQNILCALTAAAVLVGLVANSVWGIWWLDPVAGLFIAAVAFKEGRAAWRGDACCAPVGMTGDSACADECCA